MLRNGTHQYVGGLAILWKAWLDNTEPTRANCQTCSLSLPSCRSNSLGSSLSPSLSAPSDAPQSAHTSTSLNIFLGCTSPSTPSGILPSTSLSCTSSRTSSKTSSGSSSKCARSCQGTLLFGVDQFSSLNIPGILMVLLGVLLYLVRGVGKEGALQRQRIACVPLKNNG